MGTIAFPSLGQHGWDLYEHVNGEESRLLGESSNEFNAAFSPNGQAIAFVKTVRGNQDVYVHSVEDGHTRRLTRDVAMEDHPTWSPDGDHLAFVSSRKPNAPGRSWTGIYSIRPDGGDLKRLSPEGASDYSPAWSPLGGQIAFASGAGNPGGTDLYLMDSDGSDRFKLIENGGWPTFIEGGEAVAFHRRSDDGEWSIWRIGVDGTGVERILSRASMPASNAMGERLAYVDRGHSKQQIRVIDLQTGNVELVAEGSSDLWNPTLSDDGESVVYHRITEGSAVRNVELWEFPAHFAVNLLRVAGGFPVFSPDHAWVAVTTDSFSKLDLMKPDGSERHTVYTGKHRTLFGLSWLTNPGRLAFSEGTAFGSPAASVKLRSIDPFNPDALGETLLEKSGNSGFPSSNPGGGKLVFRAERAGYKNLFILDRNSGKTSSLTEGAWTDTMPNWSPTGEWIAFSSTRDVDYEIWLIRPDGTDLRKLIGGGGRNTHPCFSTDGEWIVFASQRAGYSAETVSLHRMPQPYGELFAIRLDGTGLTRLTHNALEEGTPVWAGLDSIQASEETFLGSGSF